MYAWKKTFSFSLWAKVTVSSCPHHLVFTLISWRFPPEIDKEVLCLTRRSWCRPPWGGFQTVWWACRLAGGPRRRTSLQDVPLARPGASPSPPNPLGEEQMEKLHRFRAGQWDSAGEYTPTQWGWQGGGDTVLTCTSRWQQRVKSSWSARRMVKPGSDCASVDLCACAPAG